jgi:hypothetical protein
MAKEETTEARDYSDPQPVIIACSPVWRYLLLMNQEVIGIANGIILSGANWDYADHKKMVDFIDGFLPQFRELAEKSTGYKKH